MLTRSNDFWERGRRRIGEVAGPVSQPAGITVLAFLLIVRIVVRGWEYATEWWGRLS
jgi:hypothetical protein